MIMTPAPFPHMHQVDSATEASFYRENCPVFILSMGRNDSRRIVEALRLPEVASLDFLKREGILQERK